MKQKSIMLVLMLVYISLNCDVLFSQSTVLGNTLSGGTPQTPTEFLGSNNAYDVVFQAAGTEAMRIDQSNGFVGIGTTTPVSVLHLNRNAAVGVVTQYTNPNALATNGTGFQPWLVFSFI